MPQRPRYHAQKRRAGEHGIEIRIIAEALGRHQAEENVRGEGFGAKLRTPHPRPGRPYYYGSPRREGNRMRFPQKAVSVKRDPTSYPGVALLWLSAIKYPGGTVMTNGKRNGLTGAIPKALCGEAPQGQPRNHRCNPKQVMLRPTGQIGQKERQIPKDQPSSQWRRTGTREGGGNSLEQMPGARDQTGKTWG